MKYNKHATSVNEQIIILKERGLLIDVNDSKAAEHLLDIGYYRLGFYWYPFEKDEKHRFIENTKFSDIIKLYYLDVDIRHLLLKYLYRVEINLRTKLVYHASNKFKEDNKWYMNSEFVNLEFVENISKHYTRDFINHNKTIKRHHFKYNDYAPAWKAIEFFTFGSIFKLYCSINDEELKIQIANEFGLKKTKVFINFMSTILFLRNVCSHGGVLFDLKAPKGIARINSEFLIDNDRNSLNSMINILIYFVNHISKNRRMELENELVNLFSPHKDNPVIAEIIKNAINYKNI